MRSRFRSGLRPGRRLTLAVGTALVAGLAFAIMASGASLTGSNFEIDTGTGGANHKVDNPSPSIDWLAGATGTTLRTGVASKADKPSGANDDAFGQGTAENDANPTIVDGSIPPNKSDLKNFGVFAETAGTSKFLELFWTRINSPQGTTNMDFELNQKFCDPTANPTNCANNGSGVTPETPVRTSGDKLITYDLSKGGTVPTISIRTWTGSAWSAATVLSGGPSATALGSVNTALIPANQAGGVGNPPSGTLDPFTFGEAAINFSAIFPSGGQCGTFGSAYLKSRSSDSFNAELKDFIAPERVNITNCTGLTTNATSPVTIGSPISDTADLTGATANAGGTVTFKLFSSLSNCQNDTNVLFTGTANVSGPGTYNSGNFTPTAVGTYFWKADYSGDANNAPSSSPCGAANESSVVNKKQPAVVTDATDSVTIGDSISDTATLSGATSDAGGSITFKAYSSLSDCNSDTNVAFTGTANVSGNGTYNSGNFTPTAVGTYFWVANYSGDAKNQPALTACGDPDESSVVNKAQATIATAQELFPQDSGTVSASAGGQPTGDVTFKLFGPNNPTCAEGANDPAPVYAETVALSNGKVSTSNTTFSVKTANADDYKWLVVYAGDSTHTGATSACGTEHFTLTIANG